MNKGPNKHYKEAILEEGGREDSTAGIESGLGRGRSQRKVENRDMNLS